MNSKIIIAACLIVIIAIAGFFLMSQKPEYPDIQNPTPFKGNESAKVIVEEFSDFQCPACIATEPYIEEIYKQFQDSVKLEFKQFPLSIHNYAQKAAEASFCAQDFGKFWEYHGELFKANGQLDNASLVKVAKGLGIDEAKFQNCLASGKKQARVQQDITEGTALGVNGTPTFFVNGEKVEGTFLSEIIKNLRIKIEQKIAEAQ